ncbi:ATP-binding cassette, subfamily B [Actinopolymorpha cephalotaxi]|uniref:ATP-binding cassette subfamily B protein n=1 Tax=Actinopolymorpha cephalotaxi TaxID=504797 RepID=A0A1I2YGT1_9ACTN|nr:ABC transporter ATP-binding protein [Actinopolymorpha cephalotaxi]NYH86987.1 ATP-binding cassette subfamily B protein [Actinopolymorpha cephalotaxi]SFH24637.1 ATP-binding cassette, subfamily B [Actinopolymorpha cephalotaxi]
MTKAGAFRAALDASAYSVRRAWAYSPRWLLKSIVAYLVLAVTPAAQVLAVSWLAHTSGGTAREYVPPLVALTALLGVGQVMDQNSNMIGQRTENRLRTHYQDELMRTVAALPPQRVGLAQTSATIQGCRSSLHDLGRLVTSVVASVGALVTAAALCVTVWRISPVAGVLVVAALLPNLLVFAWEARMQDEAFVPYGEWERRTEYAVEQLVSQRTATELATLGSGVVVAEVADARRRTADAIIDRILVLLTRSGTVSGGGTAILLGGALAGVVVGGSGGAGIAAGIVGVLSGVAATRSAGFSFGRLISFAPKVRAYRQFVESVSPSVDTQIRADAESVSARRLTVTYPGSDVPAIRDLSVSAEKGQIIALVGVNGAGKTTAINTILGLLEPDSGAVTVDGVDATALPLAARLGYFGLLTQEFGRYEFTVRDTIRIGRPDGKATDDEIWQALDSAHAGDFVRRLNDGLDAQLGSQFGGVGLSGGQWQRLALARIYLRGAPIWILDEPTSAIDAEAEQQIFAELQRTKSDRITIVVSHRAWTLKGMDHIYVLEEGRVVEHGTYEQLISQQRRFAQIFAEQVA